MQTLEVLDRRIKSGFGAVRKDIIIHNQKVEKSFTAAKKDVVMLKENVKQTKKQQQYADDEIKNLQDALAIELKQLGEQNKQLDEKINNIEQDLKEQYSKKYEIQLLKDKLEAENEVVNQDIKQLKKTGAKKVEVNAIEQKLDEETQKVKRNFSKAAQFLKELETNSVEFEQVKTAFLTKEELQKAVKVIEEKIKNQTEKTDNESKKFFEKFVADLHDKINSVQIEIDAVNEKVTAIHKKTDRFVEKQELEHASEKFVDAEYVDTILDEVQNLKKEFALKQQEPKEDKAAAKQIEKISADIHDKVNNTRKEIDVLNEKLNKVDDRLEKTMHQEEFNKISKNFVNIEEHEKVHSKLEEIKEMISAVQFSEGEIKKLRSNVDNIIVALVPKKEHEKTIETIHKKIKSLKEDIDELEKKV